MIESQRNLFKEFKITSHDGANIVVVTGAAAVIFIEEKMEQLRAV